MTTQPFTMSLYNKIVNSEFHPEQFLTEGNKNMFNLIITNLFLQKNMKGHQCQESEVSWHITFSVFLNLQKSKSKLSMSTCSLGLKEYKKVTVSKKSCSCAVSNPKKINQEGATDKVLIFSYSKYLKQFGILFSQRISTYITIVTQVIPAVKKILCKLVLG